MTRALHRRRNRPAETRLRQPDGFAPPPRSLLAARIEDVACEALRERGVSPDLASLALVPRWPTERLMLTMLDAAGDYVAQLDAGGPGWWRLDYETDAQGRPGRVLISDVWTTVVRPITWSQRHVTVGEEVIAFAAKNAARRFARAVATLTASLLIPATPGGAHVH